MTPMTRDVEAVLVNQMTISTSTFGTQRGNTICIWMTEADGGTSTTIQKKRDLTHICDPDSNSRKVTGQKITTTSDQVNHLSETNPTEHGTRRFILDHTPSIGPSNIGSIDVDNYKDARSTIHYPTRHSYAQINQPKDTPRTTPGTTDSCTDYT